MTFEIPQDIEDGRYVGVLESVTEEPGKFGPMRKWHWLLDVKGAMQSFTQFTPATTGPGTISFKQLVTLLGRTPAQGEKIETPTGVRVFVNILHNDKGYPKVDTIEPYSDAQQALGAAEPAATASNGAAQGEVPATTETATAAVTEAAPQPEVPR